jgi:hypothetical protein
MVSWVEAFRSAGFELEVTEERFRIRFDRVLAWLRRAWDPSGFSIHPADTVDEDRLFILDNTLRQATPGTDGWRGDRAWFHEDVTEPTSPLGPRPTDPTHAAQWDDGRRLIAGSRVWLDTHTEAKSSEVAGVSMVPGLMQLARMP